MNTQVAEAVLFDGQAATADSLAQLAPRPRTLPETGLSRNFLCELIAKHLYSGGVLTLHELSKRVALAGPVLEELIASLRLETCVEVRGAIDDDCGLRYALTDRGRAVALDALAKSGYIGRAPVPLHEYERIVYAQSVHDRLVTQADMASAFKDVVLQDGLLDQLGPALHSGRPMFLYGPPGAGKTFVGKLLATLFSDHILVPHAIALGDQVIQFFDPVYHQRATDGDTFEPVMLDEGHDPRYLCCRRPVVITGGELTLDMLELAYDPSTRQYQAPLHLKANNGLYMIDDLGRQRVQPGNLLNRWIVPMEERRDFLSLGSGEHFSIPFEVVLVFSTNLNPLDLADDAFLRRLGYKIHFGYLDVAKYAQIWLQVCEQRGIEFDSEVLKHVVQVLYQEENVPMLPCHPRDLIGLALDWSRYQGRSNRLTFQDIQSAWGSYFVRLEPKD